MKRKVLGKGLSALLPDPDPAPAPGEVPVDEPRARIPTSRGRGWSRRRWPSWRSRIRESGMVQPILVRRHGRRVPDHRGRAALAGRPAGRPGARARHRARRARRPAPGAGPGREHPARGAVAARGGAGLPAACRRSSRLTQEQVAAKVGKDRSTVANTLRLLRLPAEIRALIDGGPARRGPRARAAGPRRPRGPAGAGPRGGARAASPCARSSAGWPLLRAPARAAPRRRRDPNTRAAEEKLRAALGTRVQISRRGRGGVLRIAFASEGELQRLFETLVRAGARARLSGRRPARAC